MPDVIDPANFPGLQSTLSTDRISTYIRAEGGDIDRGLRLYTWNIEVSSAFWGVIHAVEIVMRNAMHDQLAQRFGRPDWWNAPGVTLTHLGDLMLADATKAATKLARTKNRAVAPGDVVAKLSFGFWASLTGRGGPAQYETQFWQPALNKAFPHRTESRRAPLSRNLESIRLFRNRVAHHEPIFGRHLTADHNTLISVADAIDTNAASYIRAHSRVTTALARRSVCVATGANTSF